MVIEKMNDNQNEILTEEEIETLGLTVYRVASRLHKRYCSYPCFTLNDIKKALIGDPPEFLGNVSEEHFWDCFYRALSLIVDEIGKHIEIRD